MTKAEDLLACPFCGSNITHVESWAKSFDPPRLYHEWHHDLDDEECWVRQRGKIVARATDDVTMQRSAVSRWNTRLAAQADAQGGEIQDTYLVGGPPDLKAMSGSIDDRVIQLHFRRRATDADRKWLLEAINAKLLADASPTSSDARGGEVVAWQYRFNIAGWLPWKELEYPLENFKSRFAFNLENGTCELRPLYATPPLSIEPQRAGVQDTRPDHVATVETLRTLAALFSESAHETWTREEIINIIEDAIRLGAGHVGCPGLADQKG